MRAPGTRLARVLLGTALVAAALAWAAPAHAAGPATLTLVTTVNNDNGGTTTPADWAPWATDGTTTVGGYGGVIEAEVPAGDYTLSVAPDPLPGYVYAWSCTTTMVDAVTVAVPAGTDATCILTLDDVPATLTLDALVVDDTSGVSPTAWTLTAQADGATVTGATGSAATTDVSVPGGNYALRSSGPEGYVGTWDCEGGTLTADTVAVPLGTAVTCTLAVRAAPMAGDDVTAPASAAPSETLAVTGGEVPVAALWVGGGALVVGLVIVAFAIVRRRRGDR